MPADLENGSTPLWAVRRLIEEVWLPPGTWLEPCAGNGNIVRAVREDRPEGIHFTMVELQLPCKESLLKLSKANCIHCPREFVTGFSPHEHRQLNEGPSYFDVAITHPPMSIALAVTSKCLTIAEYVAILQPSGWLLHLKKPDEFILKCPPDIYVLPDDFNGTTYAWFCWGPKNERFRSKGITQELYSTSPKELVTLAAR